ncbi:NAD(P)-dependent oxidoreductase [Blastochloris tepida]|uniref:precorrin-2 dehydrogenase n=1 Tax=Blastochloris tepida TaxID=2233851 RepID=A0A348G1M2_9HYPH|nr:NAD(P)-dependent oxidoreductase [Blastochloris tepida]BBF93455.1 hypothetical protein BLTE_21400 [Blastochloris tepida]
MARFRFLPVSHDVAGRRVVVVGEGAAALQKLRLLARTEAALTLVAANPSPALERFAASHGITRSDGDFCAYALDDVALAIIATGDADTDARHAAHAHAQRVPVNVVDRPQLSDFAMPAIIDRAPISVAVATDGHAPVLATRIRGMIEALLPPNLGQLAVLAGSVRSQVLDRLADPVARRRFWTGLLEGRAAELALAGAAETAAQQALADLDQAIARTVAGAVLFIGTGPGEADLMTLRAHRLLLGADVLVHDSDAPEDILALARRDIERIGIDPPRHGAVYQPDEVALLTQHAGAGRRVVRLVPGDAAASAFVRSAATALRVAGIACDVVPGVAGARPAACPSTRRAA